MSPWSINNIKQDSTERTESSNYRMNSANSIHDNESVNNTNEHDDVVDDDGTGAGAIAAKYSTLSMNTAKTTYKTARVTTKTTKHKTRSEAFLTTTPTAVSGKPTPAPLATVSRVQMAEAIPPPQSPTPLQQPAPSSSFFKPSPPSSQSHRMTSQHFINTNKLSGTTTMHAAGVSDYRLIDDGECRQGYSEVDDQNASFEQRYDQQGSPMANVSPVQRTNPELGQMEQLNYCSNASYTFVKYYDPEEANNEQEASTDEIPDEECFADSCTRLTPSRPSQSFKSLNSSSPSPTKRVSDQQEQQEQHEPQYQQQQSQDREQQHTGDNNRYDREVEALLDDRANFFECCKEDPLYSNPHFPQPWKVLSKISQSLVQEIMGKFANDLSFGEESYIQDFINMEMQS